MHCKASKYKYINIKGKVVREHQLIVEAAIGRKLKGKERIHHIDKDKSNNTPSNLVLCPNDAYHMLLHRRQEALDISGDANNIKCQYCSKFDKPENIITAGKTGKARYHLACKRECQRKWRNRI